VQSLERGEELERGPDRLSSSRLRATGASTASRLEELHGDEELAVFFADLVHAQRFGD